MCKTVSGFHDFPGESGSRAVELEGGLGEALVGNTGVLPGSGRVRPRKVSAWGVVVFPIELRELSH